jgi:hypothetical protein
MKSAAPPAGKGTTNLIGRSGYAALAAIQKPNPNKNLTREFLKSEIIQGNFEVRETC